MVHSIGRQGPTSNLRAVNRGPSPYVFVSFGRFGLSSFSSLGVPPCVRRARTAGHRLGVKKKCTTMESVNGGNSDHGFHGTGELSRVCETGGPCPRRDTSERIVRYTSAGSLLRTCVLVSANPAGSCPHLLQESTLVYRDIAPKRARKIYKSQRGGNSRRLEEKLSSEVLSKVRRKRRASASELNPG